MFDQRLDFAQAGTGRGKNHVPGVRAAPGVDGRDDAFPSHRAPHPDALAPEKGAEFGIGSDKINPVAGGHDATATGEADPGPDARTRGLVSDVRLERHDPAVSSDAEVHVVWTSVPEEPEHQAKPPQHEAKADLDPPGQSGWAATALGPIAAGDDPVKDRHIKQTRAPPVDVPHGDGLLALRDVAEVRLDEDILDVPGAVGRLVLQEPEQTVHAPE